MFCLLFSLYLKRKEKGSTLLLSTSDLLAESIDTLTHACLASKRSPSLLAEWQSSWGRICRSSCKKQPERNTRRLQEELKTVSRPLNPRLWLWISFTTCSTLPLPAHRRPPQAHRVRRATCSPQVVHRCRPRHGASLTQDWKV